ncbi:hypothetical protein DFS33DRAFT_1269803 [Desarmillaria ectypa]|nr:hypothetical protein DFS33DRAFT_1269803 [Desarmillaria ectypa]
MGTEAAIFSQNHTDVDPSQDSRLYLLLSMAGSPSIRSMTIPADTFYDSLFIRIVQGIGDFLGIKSLLSYDDGTAAVPLDNNLLNSTFPLPPFLAKDWCTPQLATKSIQIAFEDTIWLSPDCYHSAYELGTYFFQSTSFTNETLAYFVSSVFEQLRTQTGRGLPIFLDLIVTGLASDDLNGPHETKTLRRLALLRPKDPAWTGCIQRLQGAEHQAWEWIQYDTPRVITDFKAFIEAECVGAFGKDVTVSSNPVQPAQGEDDNSPQHLWSKVWRRVRQFIAGDPSRKEIELSSNDNGV